MIGWGVMFFGEQMDCFPIVFKETRLSRSDYVYIKQHLKEAGQKLVRLKKLYLLKKRTNDQT
ncbi:hypothetical protein ACEQPO_30780 [Bacillus sp. SL00103]